MTAIKIHPIPAFTDNYIWLCYDELTRDAWVVDPGDAAPVIAALQQYDLQLKGILITHHHHDHTGGVNHLQNHYKNLRIIGSHRSHHTFITERAKDGDNLHCAPLQLKAMEIPGHTLDHVALYNSDLVFCGDTLFSFGCGRIFEGTPEQMHQSLNKLRQLPDRTQIYCGHEYTLANLYFAQQVEPNNLMIDDKINAIKKLREITLPSLPSNMKIEKQLNPFLRCDQPTIIEAVENYHQKKLNNPTDVFRILREWKNTFKK
jgi:hydroxyacylglutathione hydrolase